MHQRLPVWAVFVVLAAIVLQGLYASQLNHLYYSRYSPFFDSMSYHNQMAEVLAAARSGGMVAGFRESMNNRTVTLPWLTASVLAPWLPYSRLVGVWMQEAWMAALAVSLLAYWRFYRGAPISLALLWTVPPVSFAAVYRANGGISDFRMDLSLYIFFALAVLWYLATRETSARLPWIFSAAAIALCCWSRATAPAYLGVALGPLLLARWFSEPSERNRLVRRVGAYWLPAALVGLLPVMVNWDYIHYYYFIWGADPNANLPLRESAVHFLFAGVSLGIPLAWASSLLLGAHLIQRRPRLWLGVDWPVVWIALAPALLLTLTGAGPNAFASMPAVFGGLLFCLAPFRGQSKTTAPLLAASALVVSVCVYQARTGYYDHAGTQDGTRPAMAPLKQGIDLIRADSARRGRRKAQFLTAHLADFQATALRDVLLHELGAVPRDGGLQLPDGLWLAARYEDRFSTAVPVSWARVPGENDSEKFRYLTSTANAEVDYFFLPDEPSITWIEQHRAYNFINVKMRRLKQELIATGQWVKLGEPLRISNVEAVELFVNAAR